MEKYIISKEQLNSLYMEEEKTGKEFLEWLREEEHNGLLYSVYVDKRNGNQYEVQKARTVHMGFNSNEEGKLDELVEIVESEGICNASWGVSGRTAHVLLAQKLEKLLPQYEFEIDYDMYRCTVKKRV